jgi:hypothetical protein
MSRNTWAPTDVIGCPPVAAASAAGHAVAFVGAVDVVPAGVTAERASTADVAALAVAFEAVRPWTPLQSGHGTMRALPGGVMVSANVVTSRRCRSLPRMHYFSVIRLPTRHGICQPCRTGLLYKISIGAELHFSRLSRQALGQLEARYPDPVTSNRRTWSVVCDGPIVERRSGGARDRGRCPSPL